MAGISREREWDEDDFHPTHDRSRLPEGVLQQRLPEIIQITQYWGIEQGKAVPEYVFGEKPVIVSISTITDTIFGDVSIRVMKTDENGNFSPPAKGISTTYLDGGILVFWDDRVTVEDLDRFIQASDKWGDENGYKIAGKRYIANR